MSESGPRVAVLMGSDSDLEVVRPCLEILGELGIAFEARVMSAHRTPDKVAEFSRGAAERGVRVLICAAGHAAHLAGAVAAQTILPVIGIPIASSDLHGVDALYSTVQMPPGTPVATVALGKPGARNAGILAAQIMALSDEALRARLVSFKEDLGRKAAAADETVRRQFPSGGAR
jgi:phosphoribosylaminoimidazole carboxylase PurE protein